MYVSTSDDRNRDFWLGRWTFSASVGRNDLSSFFFSIGVGNDEHSLRSCLACSVYLVWKYWVLFVHYTSEINWSNDTEILLSLFGV